MNYIILIIIIFIIFLIGNNYINGDKKYMNQDISQLTDQNTGFVKPEHRLLKIFNNISTGSKIKLEGKCSQYIDNKNTITKDLNDKLNKNKSPITIILLTLLFVILICFVILT